MELIVKLAKIQQKHVTVVFRNKNCISFLNEFKISETGTNGI